MKSKFFKRLLFCLAFVSLFGSLAGCTPTEENYDFSGDLDNMNVVYKQRENSIEAQYWWSIATLTDTEHYLVITTIDKKETYVCTSLNSASIDFVYLKNFFANDNAFEKAMEIACKDYDYKQVFLAFSRPYNVDMQAFSELLSKTVSDVRKYAAQAEIYFVSSSSTELAAFGELNAENTVALESYDEKASILATIKECEIDIEETERENKDFISGKREVIEWANIGFDNANLKADAKRILLIGDSISMGYYPFVKTQLPDCAIDFYQSSRGLNDVAFLRELEFIFAQYDYDLIHFNNGLHSHGQSADEYAQNLKSALNTVMQHEPNAKIVFTNSTPVSEVNPPHKYSAEASSYVIAYNEKAKAVCAELNIPYNDLFNTVLSDVYDKIDTVHYAQSGYVKLGAIIAQYIKEASV